MKTSLYKVFAGILCAFAVTGQVFAAESPVFVRGIRPLGMGGAFVAVADDQNAFFYNPAGITQRRGGMFTLFELPVNINDDVFKFVDFFNANKEDLENFDTLPYDRQVNLLNRINRTITTYRAAARTGLPNTSFLTGTGPLSWGMGLFTQADISARFDPVHMVIPTVSFWGNVDLEAGIPLAYRFNRLPYIPGSLSVGATVKYINRARIEELGRSILAFEEFDPAIQWGNGLGFDLGTLYQPTDRWNLGLQITDAGGTSLKYQDVKADKAGQTDKPAFTGTIMPEWNVGAAYIPSKIYYWPGRTIDTRDRLILACDLRDIASTDERLFSESVFKKLHLGAELRWGPASLRGGFSSGYPALGIGVRIPYLGLKVDYAYWGDELGRFAGQLPSMNHQLSLSLSWGDGKGRAYGSDTAKRNVPRSSAKARKPVMQEAVAVPQATATQAAPETAPAAGPALTPAAATAQTDAAPGTGAASVTGTPAQSTAPAAPGSGEVQGVQKLEEKKVGGK